MVERRAGVADVDASLVEVEPERSRASLPQRQRRGRLHRVGEADHLSEPHRAVLGVDLTQHAAGLNRGELVVVADQPDAAAAADDERHRGLQGERVSHARLVDDHQRVRSDLPAPGWKAAGRQPLGEDVQRVGLASQLLGQRGGRGGRRSHSEYVTAGLAPRRCQRAHRRRLAGTGWGDRQLQTFAGRRHPAHQVHLARVQLDAVGERGQQRQADRPLADHHAVPPSGESKEPRLRVQDLLRGVDRRVGHRVDRAAVRTPQRRRLADPVPGRAEPHREALQRQVDNPIQGRRKLGNAGDPHLAQRLGTHVPGLPPRPVPLDHRHHVGGQRLQPALVDHPHRVHPRTKYAGEHV